MIAAPALALKALGWLKAVPWQAWALVALCVVLVALRWHWIGVGEDRVQAQWDAQNAVHAQQLAAAKAEARATETRIRTEYADAVARLKKEQADAQAAHDAVVADLRSGVIRLRRSLRCPAAGGMPSPATATAGSDGADGPGFGQSDIELVLRVARDGDTAIRRLTACQAALRAATDSGEDR